MLVMFFVCSFKQSLPGLRFLPPTLRKEASPSPSGAREVADLLLDAERGTCEVREFLLHKKTGFTPVVQSTSTPAGFFFERVRCYKARVGFGASPVPASELSGGQRTLCAIALLFAVRPRKAYHSATRCTFRTTLLDSCYTTAGRDEFTGAR